MNVTGQKKETFQTIKRRFAPFKGAFARENDEAEEETPTTKMTTKNRITKPTEDIPGHQSRLGKSVKLLLSAIFFISKFH